MKTYKIPCTWEMYGTLFIEADSLKEAMNKALDPVTGLPKNGEYIEDSFKLDDEYVIKEQNEEGEFDNGGF